MLYLRSRRATAVVLVAVFVLLEWHAFSKGWWLLLLVPGVAFSYPVVGFLQWRASRLAGRGRAGLPVRVLATAQLIGLAGVVVGVVGADESPDRWLFTGRTVTDADPSARLSWLMSAVSLGVFVLTSVALLAVVARAWTRAAEAYWVDDRFVQDRQGPTAAP